MKISKKVRFSLIWLSFLIIWTLVLGFSKWAIFPCLTFVFDSDQGYYHSTCPLVDEDGKLVFIKEDSGYSGTPSVFTWPAGILILLGGSLVPSLITWTVYQRVSLRPKA